MYDTLQITGFIGSELKVAKTGARGATLATLAERWAPRLSGKVASVKVAARRPRQPARKTLRWPTNALNLFHYRR